MTIADESLGDWHPDRISTIVSLGKLYREIGRFDLAEPLLTRAADASRQAFPPKEPRLVATLEELAKLYQLTDRLADAETLLREIQGQAPEGKSRGSALALLQLGDQQNRLGEREKAAALYAQAAKILAEIADGAKEQYRLEHRPDSFHIYVDLTAAQIRQAWIMMDDGRAAEARTLAREAFLHMVQFARGTPMKGGKFSAWETEMRTVQPSERMMQHPDYSRVMIRLADLFVALGDFIPARASIAVTDSVSNNILSRRDSSILYRTTAKLYENQPKFDLGLWPGHLSERQRLDFIVKRCKAKNDDDEADRQRYIASAQLARPGDKLPQAEAEEIRKRLSRPVGLPRGLQPDDDLPADYALDWLKIATREFEATSGPGHPETIEGHAQSCPSAVEAPGTEAGRTDPGRSLEPDRRLHREDPPRPARDPGLFLSRIKPARPGPPALVLPDGGRGARSRRLRGRLAQQGDGHSTGDGPANPAPGRRDREPRTEESGGRTPGHSRAVGLAQPLYTPGRKGRGPPGASGGTHQAQRRPRARGRPPGRLVPADPGRRSGLDRRHDPRFAQRDGRRRLRRASGMDTARGRRQSLESLANLRCVCDPRRRRGTGMDGHLGEPGGRRRHRSTAPRLGGRNPPGSRRGSLAGRPGPATALGADRRGPDRLQDGDPDPRRSTGRRPLGRASWQEGRQLSDRGTGSRPGPLRPVHRPVCGRRPALGSRGAAPGWGRLWATGEVGGLAGDHSRGPATRGLLPSGQAIRLGDQAATKRRLIELAPNRRFIHLATHGEFLDTGPERDRSRFLVVDQASGGAVYDVSARNPLLLTMLVLSGANRPVRTDKQGLPIDSDSFITAEEVMGLDLGRTELVVLSACDTGIGKIRGSAGVFSLQRAFHVAGSRSVLASLWQISDKSTQVLMQRFYDNLLRKKMSKIEALREAQIWMLREGVKHPELIRGLDDLPDPQPARKGATVPPYYWAAFVLSGDWR